MPPRRWAALSVVGVQMPQLRLARMHQSTCQAQNHAHHEEHNQKDTAEMSTLQSQDGSLLMSAIPPHSSLLQIQSLCTTSRCRQVSTIVRLYTENSAACRSDSDGKERCASCSVRTAAASRMYSCSAVVLRGAAAARCERRCAASAKQLCATCRSMSFRR